MVSDEFWALVVYRSSNSLSNRSVEFGIYASHYVMTLGYIEFTPPKKFSEHALLEFENFDFWRFMRCSPE